MGRIASNQTPQKHGAAARYIPLVRSASPGISTVLSKCSYPHRGRVRHVREGERWTPRLRGIDTGDSRVSDGAENMARTLWTLACFLSLVHCEFGFLYTFSDMTPTNGGLLYIRLAFGFVCGVRLHIWVGWGGGGWGGGVRLFFGSFQSSGTVPWCRFLICIALFTF